MKPVEDAWALVSRRRKTESRGCSEHIVHQKPKERLPTRLDYDQANKNSAVQGCVVWL